MLELTPTDVEQIFNKEDATETVENMINALKEYEEIMETVKPLFFTLSVLLYGDNAEPVQLAKLVEDAVTLLKPGTKQ